MPNKFTGELREAILAGVNGAHPEGLSCWVRDLATETPTSAAALLGRLVPLSTDAKFDAKLVGVIAG